MADLQVRFDASYERQAIAKFIEQFGETMSMEDMLNAIRTGSYLEYLFSNENKKTGFDE